MSKKAMSYRAAIALLQSQTCGTHARCVEIVAAEVERLRAALEKYGEHSQSCARRDWLATQPVACDCGFSAALAGKEG